MTVDAIAYHALTRPDAVAVIDHGRRITYADFHRDIWKFIRAVQELGVRPGGSVAIGCEDLYTHWLLLLAFERLGIATASLMAGENSPSTAPLLAMMDLVMSDSAIVVKSPIKRYHEITAAWLDRAWRLEPLDVEPRVRRTPADVIRVLRTSGTTGASKRMLLRRRMHEARLANWLSFGIARQHRFQVSMPFTMHAVYSVATVYIRAGATVVHDSRRKIGETLVDFEADHVILMPKQLRQMLDQLPESAARGRLVISSLGAGLPAALRTQALSRIAADVLDMYACNEVGLVAVTHGEGEAHGALWPGVEVEVVDEQERPLPHGQPGTIRIATEAMVEGYLDDPETTARMFRGGWFYPGDMGVLYGARRLQVLGRTDDLLNVGGEKLSPVDLEERIIAAVHTDEIAACTVPDREGVEQLCIAVKSGLPGEQGIADQITRILRPVRTGQMFVVVVPEIPRTASGKIQRSRLRSVALEALRRAKVV